MSEKRKNLREVKTSAAGDPEQPSQHRRRLVKGALSAPVFLTLQNGSVFANTSNDAEIAQTRGDEGDNPVCVFSNDDMLDGDKIDFGENPVCFFEQGNPAGQFTIREDQENPLVCDVNGLGNEFKGGYVVAGSSGASICPPTI
jgi:hypothetical protein